MSRASRQYTLQNREGFIVCHWCTQEMPALAKNCPHCQKLRIDIHKAKANFYTFAIVFGLLFIGAVALTSKMAVENHWWSVVVPPSSSPSTFSFGKFTIDTPSVVGFTSYKFSVEKFLSSGSGIFLIIFGVVTMVVIGHLGHRVSKKLGTSFWI